jgi:hypothetical protein
MAELQQGDRVRWNTPQGETTGKIVAIAKSPTSVEGTDLNASEDDPRYIVQSESTGKRAGHRADALTKVD